MRISAGDFVAAKGIARAPSHSKLLDYNVATPAVNREKSREVEGKSNFMPNKL